MENTEELTGLAKEVDKILKEELRKKHIQQDFAEARVYNVKSIGVQGDQRTYAYPAEITLFLRKNFIWEPKFLSELSNKITNEIKDINRVVYVTAIRS